VTGEGDEGREGVMSPYREFWDHVSLKDCFDLVAVWLLLFEDLTEREGRGRVIEMMKIRRSSGGSSSYISHSSKSNKTSFLGTVIL
jgi:hypothetical protein